MIDVYLLLGSNLGNRQLFLQQAITHIQAQVGQVIRQSAVYETASWGKIDAPAYLNQVLLVQTNYQPRALLNELLQIELLLGRVREEKWGSRTMDIDILFYDNDIINEPGLIIPHPELHKRRFTLEPLAEIAPHLQHPLLDEAILVLKNKLSDNLEVKKL
ncbi:2-amino-4-hydroxy-6-hydroxymethyldihydropteridine diphosphokinase [Mucilaginibacter sp. Bleaf8]|uniref:2-amino-4-hydroxy-6- hydroxymethyldihydropteridine diphosphokinase n=1 Tax=Mucilaginibacter sp. Bleaf8 TaxID=2834430 RepID=UPI001BCC0DF8|nr:2-amino-4-hydroxy-6-hydroxymethyldihydropteridine diphosphokinase [Mucilaginibacter sp. Bleaf8]MBS7563538.1 2-amino-4-hydroxy-6-hydroxymethyldihydropteridine diphosphokinase [Mucilaginibacter sp. Bleaf8]